MANQYTVSQIFKHPIKHIFAFFSICLFLSCSSFAQEYSSSNKKAIKIYQEAQAHYQKFELKKTEELLEQAIERDPTFIEAATLLAYVNIDQKNYEAAKVNFKKAIAINPNAIPNNLFFLAELELQSGEYQEAEKNYRHFLTTNPTSDNLITKTNSGLESIAFAINAMKNPVDYKPENLGPEINSEHAEYFPSLTVDEQTLLFTRRLPSPQSPQGFNEDFYVAYKVDGKWQQAYNLNKPINTIMNEGAPSLSADGQILFFTACELYGDYGGNRKGYGSCDIFYSSKMGKNWSEPSNLGKPINSNHWETQPSFSADGKTLYFIRGLRDRQGQRNGDIYVSELNEQGFWSKPEALPKNINTPMNEESVFIHPDGSSLYFSSDGHPGMGGLDIFMSKKDSTGNWGDPVNIGYPVNTYQNENSLLVSSDGKTAFFASDREDGYGDLDLYSFELAPAFRPNAVSYFAGKITDKKTKEPLQAKFELIDLANGEIVVESYSNSIDGEFFLSLPSGREYALNASKNGYLFYSDHFALKENTSNSPFKKDIKMQPIEVGQTIVLKNIFFETAKYNLKASSKVELNKLVGFLKSNPALKIEIGGHTDNVGKLSDNLLLSKNRANAVLDYLIEAQIEPSRLTAIGYADKLPIADNASSEGRAQNRRTEFKIIEN